MSRRDGVDFNLASIPESFDLKPSYDFDPQYMKALFQVGYEEGKAGYHWAKVPPGFAETAPAHRLAHHEAKGLD